MAGGWFQCAHALPLKYVLDGIAWLPAELGANRENHIVRSTAVVKNPIYAVGKITYSTYDAPKNTVEPLLKSSCPAPTIMQTKLLIIEDDLSTASALQKGVNVLALEVIRAPYDKAVAEYWDYAKRKDARELGEANESVGIDILTR